MCSLCARTAVAPCHSTCKRSSTSRARYRRRAATRRRVAALRQYRNAKTWFNPRHPCRIVRVPTARRPPLGDENTMRRRRLRLVTTLAALLLLGLVGITAGLVVAQGDTHFVLAAVPA